MQLESNWSAEFRYEMENYATVPSGDHDYKLLTSDYWLYIRIAELLAAFCLGSFPILHTEYLFYVSLICLPACEAEALLPNSCIFSDDVA